jgi:molybdate transport system substrate-binding protein
MRLSLVAVFAALAAVSLPAAEISTLATAAIDAPLHALATEFRRQSGHDVKVQTDTSPNISRRLAGGETPDVLIALPATVDQVIKEGKAVAASRANVGKIGVGVAVNRGGRRPDISSVDALKAELMRADAVLYSQGASGLYVEQMLRNIGIADQIKAKTTQLPTGTAVMTRLGKASGTEIGFTMVSEIRQGEQFGGSLVGPLPPAIQSYTAFDVVMMSGSKAPDAARAFIRALTAPAARKTLGATGWEF